MILLILAARVITGAAMLFLTAYAIRHYLLALCRLRNRDPRDYSEIAGFVVPRITVLIPMHNEERVAADILKSLVECDYDWKRLEIIPIDDRSTDGTKAIIDDFAARHPDLVKPLHRDSGEAGKPAALKDATKLATGEILILFDADYIPGRSMLKMLVAPFADAEIGAVMGRVTPQNLGESMLSALLSLERAAGYQTVQQARYNAGFNAQFGGTVGGVRRSALESAGGWNERSLTEDTDLTFALTLRGWRVAYVNRAECYEEAPATWAVRRRQLTRWVTGHTQCMHDYLVPVLRCRHLSKLEKVDAAMLLGMYWTAPVMIIGWLASLVLFFATPAHYVPAFAAALILLAYQIGANQATFSEIGVAAMLDGSGQRALLLPFNLLHFFTSAGAISAAIVRFYWRSLRGKGNGGWDKTGRSRNGSPDSANAENLITRGPDGRYYLDPAKPKEKR